jgi:hypothetical protein
VAIPRRSRAQPGPAPGDRRKAYDSLLDRLDALRVLRGEDEAEKGALLEEVAELGAPEHDIVQELLGVKPLAQPERFEEAHRRVMGALEVLERNGGRRATVSGLGSLGGAASVVVSWVAGWIARQHRFALVGTLGTLYAAREANAAAGSVEHHMHRRARLQTAAVEQSYGGSGLGIPTFLLGGAALSTTFAALRNLLGSAFEFTAGTILVPLVLGAIVAGLSWACLEAAAVARHRIRLSTDRAVSALWKTIGACGEEPSDHSLSFAILAILLLVASWLAIPALIWLLAG